MKVVCIKDMGDCGYCGTDASEPPLLSVGQVYTVTHIELFEEGPPEGYKFAEIENETPDDVWCCCCFRDVDDDSEDLIKKIKKPILEDA